jgi:hypothetical protein
MNTRRVRTTHIVDYQGPLTFLLARASTQTTQANLLFIPCLGRSYSPKSVRWSSLSSLGYLPKPHPNFLAGLISRVCWLQHCSAAPGVGVKCYIARLSSCNQQICPIEISSGAGGSLSRRCCLVGDGKAMDLSAPAIQITFKTKVRDE